MATLTNTQRKDLEDLLISLFIKQIPLGEKIDRTMIDGVSTLAFKSKKLIQIKTQSAGELWEINYVASPAKKAVDNFLAKL
jgi:hypothetical protein